MKLAIIFFMFDMTEADLIEFIKLIRESDH